MLTIGAPMGLENLSHAGLAEFSRQWILLNRREAYQGDGNHDLWLTVGGSAGHGGLWNLHIEEGTADENFSGRRWNVTVPTASEVKNVVADKKAQAKQEATDRKSADEQRRVLAAIDAEVDDGRAAATRRRIKERTGFAAPKVTDILEGLVEGGSVQEVQFDLISGNGAKKSNIGYQRAPT
jgi:hypothetical protein